MMDGQICPDAIKRDLMPKMTRRRFIRDILSFPRVRKELGVPSLSFRNKEQVSDNLRAMIDIDAMDAACRKFMVSMKAACLYHQKLNNATLNIFMVLLSLDNSRPVLPGTGPDNRGKLHGFCASVQG